MSTPDTSIDDVTLATAEALAAWMRLPENLPRVTVNAAAEYSASSDANKRAVTIEHVVAIARRLQGEKAELRHELHAIYHGGMTSDCWKPPFCERAEKAEAEVRELRATITLMKPDIEIVTRFVGKGLGNDEAYDAADRLEVALANATTGDKT